MFLQALIQASYVATGHLYDWLDILHSYMAAWEGLETRPFRKWPSPVLRLKQLCRFEPHKESERSITYI